MSLSLDALRLAAAQSPTNLPLLMLLADACLADMQVDEARQTLERVLALEPRHALARVGLARVAVLEGDNVLYSQLTRHEVQIDTSAGATQFLVTDDNVQVPIQPGSAFRVYVGYDEGPYNTP